MISYQIDGPRRLVLVTASGAVSAEELRKYQADLRADPDFDPSFALMADFRAASLSEVTASDLRSCAEEAPFGPEAPRAYVVSDDADYGLGRMFEAYSELVQHQSPVRIFRDADSAWTWIGDERAGRG